jgi:hypothetical protein
MAVVEPGDRLARGKFRVGVDDGGRAFRLRQHDGVGPPRHHRVEVGVDEACLDRVDADEEARAPALCPRFLEERRRARARLLLALGGDRILEINDHRIGAGGKRLLELCAAVGRDEQERAHGRGPRRCK